MSDVDTFLQPRNEDGQFASVETKAEPVAVVPAQEQKVEPIAEPVKVEPVKVEQHQEQLTDKERAFMAAARDERNKRQALEARLQELEAAKQPEKEFWEAPEEKLNAFEAKIQQTMLKTKIDMAESIARTRYSDFDEKIGVFAELLETTPGLHSQWMSALDPAEFAYKAGQNFMKFKESGSIEDMRAKIAAEERAKIEAEYKAKELEREKKLSAIPNSVSGINGTGASAAPVWNGPASLESLLA